MRLPIPSEGAIHLHGLGPLRLLLLSSGLGDILFGLSNLVDRSLLPLLRGLWLSRVLCQTKYQPKYLKTNQGKAKGKATNLRRWRHPHGFLLQFGPYPSCPHRCIPEFVSHVGVGFI